MKINDFKLGRFWNEFSGFQVNDYFALWIFDIPLVLVRRYRDNHSNENRTSYYLGLLGLSFRVQSSNYGQ